MRDEILALLPVDHPWWDRLQWFDSVDSTNTRCKQLALSGAPHGTVLIAGHQTAGRGRMGRSFQSPDGLGVYMSLLLRPECAPTELMHLTCAAAVAACDAIEQAAGIRPGIKWTNDLVCGNRKIAGILTELVHAPGQVCAVIGIGVNCCQRLSDFPEELQSFAGSLEMASGAPVSRAAVAAALIEAFCAMDSTLLTGQAETLDRYRADCITLGRPISLVRGDTLRHGYALDVDNAGALVVQFSDGHTEAVVSGEISVRGMYGYV